MNAQANRLYADAFAARAPNLGLRAEAAADEEFILSLSAACSPLSGILPLEIIEQQAQLQLDSHRFHHPDADGFIALDGVRPIGRMSIDWNANGAAHGIDCAVLPDARLTGAGRALLKSWLDAADALGLPATLEVRSDNRALKLYLAFGFAIDPHCHPDDPILDMTRLPIAK